MLLTSNLFLFFFFPLILIFYSFFELKYLKFKTLFLGLVSGYLYLFDNGALIIILITLSFLMKFQMKYRFVSNPIFISLIMTPLITYKYLPPIFNFYNLNLPSIINNNFPIGLSFFTFQAIAYYFDKNSKNRTESVFDIFTFLTFFPQLLAGPIVSISTFRSGISRRVHFTEVLKGIDRLSIGLIKKFLIADSLSEITSIYFQTSDLKLTFVSALIIILTYTFQIYFDFSAYCDIAIGIGFLLGFDLPENFNKPYISKSFKEFWQRWHITLSNFFKLHVYIPLGGNRTSKLKTYRNLWITFFCTALWHGASLNFLLWGFLHGLFLTFEKILNYKRIFSNRVVTFILISLTWVPFFSKDISDTYFIYRSLFKFNLLNDNFFIIFLQNLDIKLILSYIFCILCLISFNFTNKKNIYFSFLLVSLAMFFTLTATVDPFIYYEF